MVNKENPTQSFSSTLSKLCTDLRLLLVEQYDKHLKALKLTHCSSGSKAGKFLANRLKTKTFQSKIEYLLDPQSNHKIINPGEIANAFASTALIQLKR